MRKSCNTMHLSFSCLAVWTFTSEEYKREEEKKGVDLGLDNAVPNYFFM